MKEERNNKHHAWAAVAIVAILSLLFYGQSHLNLRRQVLNAQNVSQNNTTVNIHPFNHCIQLLLPNGIEGASEKVSAVDAINTCSHLAHIGHNMHKAS